MRKFTTSLLAILIPVLSLSTLSLSTITRAQEPILTIHAVNYPPYEIENPDVDNLFGFDVEVVVEAFKRMGRRAKVDFLPWKRIVAMAKSGTTVAILSCGKTPGREIYINYSNPISTATRTYAASEKYSGAIPHSIEDAREQKILVVSGYAAEKELKAADIAYEPIIDDASALRVLLKRDFDFFYTTREFIEYIAGGLGFSEKFQYFDTGKQINYHLCFSTRWPKSKELRDMFNQGLAEIRADGTYDAIHARYK